MLLYYLFRQYPNRGNYEVNDSVAHMVVIQAHDPIKANFIALTKGIYFDGIAKGVDCSCCDDRWTPLKVESNGWAREPHIGVIPLLSHLKSEIENSNYYYCATPNHVLAYVYYADGTKEKITVSDVNNRYHVFKFQNPY